MSILNNALSGASAAQFALSAVSQNLANLKTAGYTRQSALLSAAGPAAGTNQAGNGVYATALMRFSDDYKNQQLWRSNSDLGASSQTQPYLTQLEQVMGDDTASLSSGIDQFFSAMNAVAADPSSTPLRQAVVTSAGLMSQRFDSLNTVFNAQVQSITQQRSALVDAANADIKTIAALNSQISSVGAAGGNTSALIDARDQAIDSLSNKMSLEITTQPDGTRNVALKSGQSLVLGNIAGQLSVTGAANQSFSLSIAGSTFTLDPTKAGGQMGGLSSYMQDTLLPMQQGVADMAEQIASKVNDQLAQGYTAAGASGTPLFTFTPGSSSNMLEVADGFQTADLAFSSDPAAPGDTGNLQKLVAIQGQSITVTKLGSVLISDADTQLVGSLAIDSKQNKSALTTATTVRSQAESDWQSTSGVNEDEEAVNLVQYQQMYQANMKVISVANALFDATLQMMG